MSIDKTLLHFGHFFRLDTKKALDLNLPNNEMIILEEAEYILFHISFEGIKSKYNITNITIDIDARVKFDPTMYTFRGQTFSYGKYPTMSQINEYIGIIKSDVLKKIQDAMLT